MNILTVFWSPPDGKPWSYRSPPIERKKSHKEETRLFSVSDVQRFKAHALKHLPDAKFYCLSNVDVPGVDVIPLDYPNELVGWFCKYELWRPDLPKGRTVYFDLDTIILKLDGIPDFPAPFAVASGITELEQKGPPWKDQEGKWRFPGFQGSVMVWDTGYTTKFWDKFQLGKEDYLNRLASEQDFLGEQFPNEVAMPRSWFMKIRKVEKQTPSKDVRVVLTGRSHNDWAAKQYKWARQAWG